MDKAAQTLAEWDREAGEKLPLYVGVNLSAIQVARDDIAAVVASALKSSGLTGDRLTLELTESSIVQDPARATRVFDALKALDATVAMDDFGTGYSSLAYLQRLPIDVLKIDKSFVSGMMVDPDAVAIVRAVLSLAEALGMSTTAEGIETVELATTLATLGCASGQGFYFAKPLEAECGARILEVAPPASSGSRSANSGAGRRFLARRFERLFDASNERRMPTVGRMHADAQHLDSAHGAASRRRSATRRGASRVRLAQVITGPRASSCAGRRRPDAQMVFRDRDRAIGERLERAAP